MRCETFHECETCGGRLVHQARQAHESASEIGQHFMDNLPRTFSWTDIDGVIFRYPERIMRVCEHKHRGGTLRPSQATILPLLALGIQSLVERKLVSPESGVFVVVSDDLEQGAYVRRVIPMVELHTGPMVGLTGDDWIAFEIGRSCPALRVEE